MPKAEKKLAPINGEKEKEQKNIYSSYMSNEIDDNQFQVIATSRVGNTLGSLNQGMRYITFLIVKISYDFYFS